MTRRTLLAGKRFGHLTVLEDLPPMGGSSMCRALCDCGRMKDVRCANVKRGATQSCGCHGRGISGLNPSAVVGAHGYSGTPTYHSWGHMVQRCTNPKNLKFPQYGARGITVCDRWRLSFEAFLADMGPRPKGTTIDRYPDRHGNYEPGNCRWATAGEQLRNQDRIGTHKHAGLEMCLEDWALHVGLRPSTLRSRMHYGWTFERAITTPTCPSRWDTKGAA